MSTGSPSKTIVASLRAEPLGSVIIDAALRECALRSARLVVLDARPNDEQPPQPSSLAKEAERRAREAGVEVEVRAMARSRSAGTTAVWLASELDADLLIIGLRRRSPVGKLVLGSDTQDAVLGADCPILAVKAAPEHD
jgi:nucleotide-binding universal stress UspA family protein